jgi:hypothetical protein
MIKLAKWYKYLKITLSDVIFLFDHMLMNSLVYINLLLITKRHGELTKFIV